MRAPINDCARTVPCRGAGHHWPNAAPVGRRFPQRIDLEGAAPSSRRIIGRRKPGQRGGWGGGGGGGGGGGEGGGGACAQTVRLGGVAGTNSHRCAWV